MSRHLPDARFLSGALVGGMFFFESKTCPGCISLPKDNYENSNLNLPLLDRARFAGVGTNYDARAFAIRLFDRRRVCQRRRKYFARRECYA